MIRDAFILMVSPEGDRHTEAFTAEINRHAGYVHHSSAVMEALGAYITYMPHATLLDMTTISAQEVFSHLRSIDAKPLILLVDDIDNAPRGHGIYALPRSLDACTLVIAVQAILEGKSHLVLRKLMLQAS